MPDTDWPNHPLAAAIAKLFDPYLRRGAERTWQKVCQALREDFSDAAANQILAQTLDARELSVALSPPPSGYSGDPEANKRWAAVQRLRQEARRRIKQINRWRLKNRLVDAWIRGGGSRALESSIAEHPGPRPNPFRRHLILGTINVRPNKLIKLTHVLAQLCVCFDPAATGEVSAKSIEAAHKSIEAERKRLIRTIPGLKRQPTFR